MFRKMYKSSYDKIKPDEKLLEKVLSGKAKPKQDINLKAVLPAAAAAVIIIGAASAYPKLIKKPEVEKTTVMETSEKKDSKTSKSNSGNKKSNGTMPGITPGMPGGGGAGSRYGNGQGAQSNSPYGNGQGAQSNSPYGNGQGTQSAPYGNGQNAQSAPYGSGQGAQSNTAPVSGQQSPTLPAGGQNPQPASSTFGDKQVNAINSLPTSTPKSDKNVAVTDSQATAKPTATSKPKMVVIDLVRKMADLYKRDMEKLSKASIPLITLDSDDSVSNNTENGFSVNNSGYDFRNDIKLGLEMKDITAEYQAMTNEKIDSNNEYFIYGNEDKSKIVHVDVKKDGKFDIPDKVVEKQYGGNKAYWSGADKKYSVYFDKEGVSFRVLTNGIEDTELDIMISDVIKTEAAVTETN